IAALDEIGDDTQVVRRPGAVAHLRVEPPGGDTGAGDGGEVAPRLQLVLGDRRLTMPAALEPAVRRLLDGEPHRVGDLADLLDAPSRRVLVRRLVREGILCTRRAPSDA
ncbi:MAG: hypothetical protein FWJ72_01760, partial [Acidimicrobiia bacterium]